MNRRIRRFSTKPQESYLRFLKPGALAQLRDSRISARFNRLDSQSQISLYRLPSPSSPPVNAGQAFEDIPCFTGRICGPRFSQRKRLMAAKSVFYLSSTPSSPVSDSADPVINVFMEKIDLLHQFL